MKGRALNACLVLCACFALGQNQHASKVLAISVSTSAHSVSLTWNSVAGAVCYSTYRAPTSGGPYSKIANCIAPTAYTDLAVTAGTKYYYVVTETQGSLESRYSAEASAVVPGSGGSMAVAIDARASADQKGNAALTLDLTTLTVGSGANRALVVQVGFSSNPGTTTINWDATGTPQALALITGASGSNGAGTFASIYGLIAPTSGNKTLRITTQFAVDQYIFAIAFTGVDQTGGVTSFPNGTSATGAGANPSLVVTSAVGDWTVTDVTCNTTNPASSTQTSDFIELTLNNINGAGSDGTGAATVTHTWTQGANTWVMAGTSIKAAAGAAAALDHGDYLPPVGGGWDSIVTIW